MPIQENNIVFVESQVMDDVPEGGGAATGRVIVDGAMNNVFEDISDLDRALGRFNLRKIFVAVRTLDTDLFGGAKSVITALPADDAIGYALFSTADPFDTRSSAVDRVEAYLFKGPTWPGYLLENHISGMRAINVIQRVGSQLPPVGKTLCIVQNEGLANEIEQYVRVTRATVTEATFTDTSGDFSRWIVTLDLSDALRHDFAGHEAKRLDANYNYTGRARIRDTSVADATRYFGAQPLAEAAGVGDRTVRARSIFASLVPSAETESPLVNQPLARILPRSVSAGSRTVEVQQQAHSRGLDVTAENRRLNWIDALWPRPAPGAVSVSFRAQGNWYELVDDGAGTLSGGDPTIGVGTVDYVTGIVTVTLGALPDAGSQIIQVWASPVHYEVRAGASSIADTSLAVEFDLDNTPVVPTSATVTWLVGGAQRTATDNGSGAISGTGMTGTIDYATGHVSLRFTAPPDRASNITADYTWRDGADLFGGTTAAINGGSFTIPGDAPFRSGGTLRFALAPTVSGQPAPGTADAYITSGGQLRVRAGKWRPVSNMSYFEWDDQQVGTFNAATGVGTITSHIQSTRAAYTPVLDPLSQPWQLVAHEWQITGVSDIKVERDVAGYDPNTVTDESFSLASLGLRFGLVPTVGDTVVPNSVRFSLTGRTFEDRSGDIVTDIDPVTGAALTAGSIDYNTGEVTLTYWSNNQAASITVSSCLTRYGQWSAVEAFFRTAVSPLKPESLQVVATTFDGEQITGTANASGEIVGARMRGTVNAEFGVVSVEFGELVGGDWEPAEVAPETMRYNAVGFSYLPLDADILGIDAVRLPTDGRVPIYRPGDVVLVMHAAETAPVTVANGGTINCGRTRIGWIRVIDADGESHPTGFDLNRATGIVTFTDVSGMTMPVRVRHTVADLRVVTDAQITGELTLSRPLSHDYPAGESLVASCLLHGDRRARVSAVWDQQTWNGTWADSLVGNEATATLDVIAHPIDVTNEGAETERWLLRWTSTSNVELIGQRRGLVFSGPFNADIAPINPRTRAEDGTGGVPYLRIPVAANGGGWSTGNVVRINTVGAIAPIWMARAIQQSDEPMDDGADGCEIYCLGNIDRP